MNRRQILASLTAFGGAAAVKSYASDPNPPSTGGLPATILNPRSFGAIGDGNTLDSPAINAAIDACNKAGGGVVYLSPGNYLSGTVVLKSNVTLYLEAGAVLLGSKNVSDYNPQPGPGSNDDAGQRHFIFARDAENVGLAGPGAIDGQGSSYWIPSNRKPVSDDHKWSDAIHLDWEHKNRVSPMIELVNCTNLRIEDVRIRGASGWTMRPINCTNVVIQGIAIKNPVYGPNTDGIDMTGCKNVLVSDCIIDTGDDAICLKSENPYGDSPRLSQNIVITNCIITGCCNGFKIGTATQGGFENITFSNSVIYNDDVDLPSRLIAGIAIEMVDGGWVDGIVISGIQMRRARSPICIRRGDRSSPHKFPQTGLRGVMIDGIHATDAVLTSSITGIPEMIVEDVSLSNITIDTVMPGKKEWVKSPVPEAQKDYPQSRMFGWLPASGLYCRHVKGLRLKDINFSSPADEWRPTIICDDVKDLALTGFSTTPIAEGVPPVSFVNVDTAWLSGAVAPVGARALLSLQGEHTNNILVSGCDIREAGKLAEFGDGVAPNVVQAQSNADKKQSA
jgi:hypothetical protein